MEQLKAQFNRQIGPFKLWQWLLVVVAGLALGLAVRRRFGGGEASTRSSTLGPSDDLDTLPLTEGAPTIVQQDFGTVQALQQQQDRFQDELDNIKEGQTDFFAELKERIDTIKLPAQPKPTPSPTPKPPSGGQASPTSSEVKWATTINSLLKKHYRASDAANAGVGTTNGVITRSDWAKAVGDQSGVAAEVIREFLRLNLAVPSITRLIDLTRQVNQGRPLRSGEDSIRAGLEAYRDNR